MIDYAAALGAEPIITTTMTSTPDEFADLVTLPHPHPSPSLTSQLVPILTDKSTLHPSSLQVEYCWGNATTPMGAQRIRDQHPEPYRLRFIELGTEQFDYIVPREGGGVHTTRDRSWQRIDTTIYFAQATSSTTATTLPKCRPWRSEPIR